MAELALDDVEWNAFAGHLDGVRVAKLMRCKATPDAGAHGQATQAGAGGCCGPRPAARRPHEDADEGTDRQFDPYFEPRP